MTTSPLLNEIRDLQQFFTAAQNQLREGNMIDLAGMNTRISAVCEEAQKAAPNDQQILLPELMALIELLNAYEQDLRKIQAKLNISPAQTPPPKEQEKE